MVGLAKRFDESFKTINTCPITLNVVAQLACATVDLGCRSWQHIWAIRSPEAEPRRRNREKVL